MRISYDKEVDMSIAKLERALKSACSFLNYKGGRVHFRILNVGVAWRETKYILTRHELGINPPYSSTNMKHDKEERIK